MITVTGIAVTAKQVTTHPTGVLRLRGNFNGTTADRWLQVFDAVAAPADGTAPLIAAIPLYQSSPFFAEFEIGALQLKFGCYICVSTTQATKTLSSDTMDVTAELDVPEMPASSTFVGDLTTGVTGLQVWTEAAGTTTRKFLLSLEVDGTNLTTATQFIQLFATDTVNTGDTPILSIPIAVGGVKTGSDALRFSTRGREVYSYDTAARRGCTIKISSTNTTYTAPTGTACIKAEYK